jgi:hypothetical protein
VKKLLGKVELRNSYAVYEEDGIYTVAGENRRGQRYECRVVPEAVSYLCRRLKGQRVTAEQAGKTLEPVAERFELPYTYGDRLRFSGEYVLIVAVALGQASVVKEGRSYMYSVGLASHPFTPIGNTSLSGTFGLAGLNVWSASGRSCAPVVKVGADLLWRSLGPKVHDVACDLGHQVEKILVRDLRVL